MDYIFINDKEKGNIKMEVVVTYECNHKNYVIYKDKENIYIAKYNINNNELGTDLTKEEIEYGEKILEELKNNV